MAENEIITSDSPQIQMFSQLMKGLLAKLELYCASALPMLDGEEVCELLKLSTRTLQELNAEPSATDTYIPILILARCVFVPQIAICRTKTRLAPIGE